MGKRQLELECMISSSVNIVTKGWYICMDSNRGCVSSWELTQVLGSGYSPPGMVVHTVEVGPAARIPLLRCQPTGKLLQVLQYYFLSLTK